MTNSIVDSLLDITFSGIINIILDEINDMINQQHNLLYIDLNDKRYRQLDEIYNHYISNICKKIHDRSSGIIIDYGTDPIYRNHFIRITKNNGK